MVLLLKKARTEKICSDGENMFGRKKYARTEKICSDGKNMFGQKKYARAGAPELQEQFISF